MASAVGQIDATEVLVVFTLNGGARGVDIGTVRGIIRAQEHRPGPERPLGLSRPRTVGGFTMTDSTERPAQGQANGSDRSSQTGESPVDFLGVFTDKALRMTGQVIEATDGLDRIIERVESSLREARALAELHVPFSDDMLVSVRTISVAVDSMAKQVERVSSASAVLSLQSMADMARGLQKHVAKIAVAESG